MADMCDTCGDGVVELLRKLLDQERDSFVRLGQINGSIAGGSGGGGGNVNLTQIGGVAQSGADVVDVGNTALRVNVVAGGGAGGTSSTFGVANPGTGTAAGFSDGTNMQMGRVFDGDTGGGTQYVLGSILRASGAGGTVETGVAANPLRTDPTGTTTQPISAAALPLPAGAATSANQATEIASLASIDAGIPAALGQTTMAASMPVVIASNQSAIPISGTITATPTGTQDVNLIQIAGTAASVNNGASDAGTLRVTLANNSTGVIASISTSVTPGTAAANLGKAEDAAHVSGDTGVFSLSVANEAQSTLAADGDYIARSADTKGNTMSCGNIAHDGVDAGNPLKIGAVAIAHGTNPTAVAAADRTNIYANRAGIPFVLGGHPNIVSIRANYTSAQTDTAIVTVAGGLKIVVTRISITADNANTVNVQARAGFGTANTPTTTGVLISHPGIAPGSGVVEGTGAGILGVGADGEDLRITSAVPTTGSIDVVVSYFTIES